MQKLTFDIVLLPPEDITKKIIELNKRLRRDYENKRIVLDTETCLPHISLLMGTIDYDKIGEIGMRLERIAKDFGPIDLVIDDLYFENLPSKNDEIKISGASIRKSYVLSRLQDNLIEGLREYIVDIPITSESMYNPSEIDPDDTPWMFPGIRNFSKNCSGDNFKPHFTIGDGIIEKPEYLPLSFKVSRLALCHLGNYCTARKILYETEFKRD